VWSLILIWFKASALWAGVTDLQYTWIW